ncbi:hypothetical protein FA15DRAFT_704645 [Coprinopsis marcescibilis]|uniref:Uncharacterized protein n=1 Tax=Coprinopsis marcescibilis TaxID=230819 RepID=A0A5C3KVQ6_COPMA|nr:hypothetical protein FA15DRAFT_704645 [Coprinopsis marcescibilis]
MQHYTIDEFYNCKTAVASLKAVIEAVEANKKEHNQVFPITAIKWDDIVLQQFTDPKVWRFCKASKINGKIEAQFCVQGILYGKELPPISLNRQVWH